MKNVTTYVGVDAHKDAHKKDLFVAMLVGTAATPVTWQLGLDAASKASRSAGGPGDAPGPRAQFLKTSLLSSGMF